MEPNYKILNQHFDVAYPCHSPALGFEEFKTAALNAAEPLGTCFRFYLEEVVELGPRGQDETLAWFAAELGDTYDFLDTAIGDGKPHGLLEALVKGAKPRALSAGKRRAPHLFAVIEAASGVDDTPAYAGRSISECMGRFFGGNIIRDDEDVVSCTKTFSRSFNLLLPVELLDEAFARELHARLCGAAERAARRAASGKSSCRNAFSVLKVALIDAAEAALRSGRARGIALADLRAPSRVAGSPVPKVASSPAASPAARAASTSGSPPSAGSGRVYLKVAYADKEEAKLAGARWDPAKKLWWGSPSSLAATKYPHAAAMASSPPAGKSVVGRHKQHSPPSSRGTSYR